MIIRVKYKTTEIEIKDADISSDTVNNLIYYNQKYVIELLTEIVNNIKILNL